jgi:PAS domain-containing protein
LKPVNQDNIEEITSLVATLREAGQRLEELTGGEVDSVVDWDGSTILMRGVHDQLRQVETVRQSAILNALPAYIALLDGQGVIVSTNEAWLQFGKVNGGLGGEIGVNYLLLCDSALGHDSSEADRVGAGIRAVLDGSLETFSIEYPCNFPGGRHWYLMSVSPLTIGPSNGAVVMHLNIAALQHGGISLAG